ncbi:hypothetical protein VTP01DRAFT_6665 [Rhizomucor pusillus]|uniref:uncharacterized protein n=1 Tax=Rhizomucor pusillus TaxID=4840 RepID=UPI0037440BE3
MATFRETILARLDERNQREHAFHEIILATQHWLHAAIDLEKRSSELEAIAKSLEFQNETLTRNAEYAQAHGSPKNQQRVAELERRLQKLNEERAEMYKTQSENAQRLLQMNEQKQQIEKKEKQSSEEIARLNDQVARLTSKCELQTMQLKEKDVTIQILQDELAALQLEIITTEERSKKLEKENDQLLKRWLEKKNEEAEKMNEATQFYESLLERARMEGNTLKKSGGKWVIQSSDSATRTRSSTTSSHSAIVVLPNHAFKKLTAHDTEVYCVQASSTGRFFATGGTDKKIKLFDAETGNPSMILSGALQTITSVSFSSTDDMVLGTSTDNAARIWNLSTGRIRHTLTGHIGKVFAGKFTNDSKRVVSGSHDRTLKLWDLQRGYCMRTIFTFSSCNDLALVDVDGHTVVSGHLDNSLRLWDTRTGNGIKEMAGMHTGQITSVSVAPGASNVLTNSRDNTLKIIDLRMYDVVATFQADTYRNGCNWSRACFSPDSQYVAAGSADGTLHVWNALTRRLERTIKEHSGVVCGVSWSSTGNVLYTAETNKVVCMWDTSLQGSAS